MVTTFGYSTSDDDRTTVKQMRDSERLLFVPLRTVFAGIKKQVAKRVRRAYKAADIALFDVEYWIGVLTSLSGEPLSDIALAALKDSFRDMNLPQSERDLTDYEKDIARSVKNSTGKMIEGFSDDEKELRKKIKKEIENKPMLRGDDLFKRLDSITANYFSPAKIQRISQTTTTYANGDIVIRAHGRNSFESIWRHTGRGKTDRKTHVAADGQKRGEDGYFIVGGERMAFPASGSAANSINCHCVVRAGRRIT